MTIDRMDTRVDVTPNRSEGSSPPAGAPAPQGSGAPGGSAASEALRPLVLQIVEEQLELKLRIAGLR